MILAERDVTGRVPDWAVAFLLNRCTVLQRTLTNPADPILAEDREEDTIYCWNLLLVAALDFPAAHREALESLQLLHARIAERIERGGVGDISEDVEYLVRAVLVDQLQRQTDDVVGMLGA